jgi:large subunit ribosomal protein L2
LPKKSLRKKKLQPNHRKAGRNSSGKITCRHHGSGHKRLYRKIDFCRKKLNCSRYVRSIDYDPNRNAKIALLYYKDGEKSYILSPKNLKIGETVTAGFRVGIKTGNALPLLNIPLGTIVHNVELYPGIGGIVARSAGTSTQVIARENGFVRLRFPSGETRLVAQTCWATIGQVGNIDRGNKKFAKAGQKRWINRRPTVRGSAINPVDHPHGGGEGRCPIGRIHPVTPWGKPRLGVKTRCQKKYSNIFILRKKKSYFSLLL